jgi:hypothetical protein
MASGWGAKMGRKTAITVALGLTLLTNYGIKVATGSSIVERVLGIERTYERPKGPDERYIDNALKDIPIPKPGIEDEIKLIEDNYHNIMNGSIEPTAESEDGILSRYNKAISMGLSKDQQWTLATKVTLDKLLRKAEGPTTLLDDTPGTSFMIGDYEAEVVFKEETDPDKSGSSTGLKIRFSNTKATSGGIVFFPITMPALPKSPDYLTAATLMTKGCYK